MFLVHVLQTFSLVGSPPVSPSVLTSDLLKLFAFEAESAGDYELAEHYHKQVHMCAHADTCVATGRHMC